MELTFSVIVPTYNRAHIIQATLQAVLSQSFTDFEIIVVDDGSNDGTRKQVESLNSRKIRYFFKTNEERSAARNFGAEHALGRYLIFLDSDDRMRSDHLEKLHHYLKTKQFKPRFLFAGFVVYNPDGSKLYEYKKQGILKQNKLLYGNYLGCSSVVVEKELFRQFRFNTNRNLILFEDWDLWLRVLSVEPLHCIPESSIIMINHPGRSVLHYKPDELKRKIEYFYNQALQKIDLIKKSKRNQRVFTMGLYSYLALHVAINKSQKHIAWQYLFKALSAHPGFLFKRRLLGTLKQLIF